MKQGRSPFRTLSTLGLLLCLAACRPTPLTQQEQHTVTALTSQMKTQCAGRYLIDLPAEVKIYANAKLRGVNVEIDEMTQDEFLAGMHQRESELNATKSVLGYRFMYGDSDYHILRETTQSLRAEGLWHFIYLGSDAEASDAHRVIEAYKWSLGRRIKLSIEAADFTRSRHKDKAWVQEMERDEKNDVPPKLGEVFNLLASFRGLSAGEIPTEPGVCIAGGFIAGAPSDQEEISVSFNLTQHKDIFFKLETDSGLREDESLLQRSSQIIKTVKANEGVTLRKGRVKLSDLHDAQEWLASGKMQSGVRGTFFKLEANSTIGSAKTPLLSLTMKTGVFPENTPDVLSMKASLTEGESIGLWDAVSRTIRIRPGAADFMPQPSLPPLSHQIRLMPLAVSGDVCPESGSWSASCDGYSQTELVTAGQIMPLLTTEETLPYSWLPAFANRWLERRKRLPTMHVENKVVWYLTSSHEKQES